jgi:hypothetical protein
MVDNMKKYSSRLFGVIIIIAFLIMLYWVEGSNWSSQAVAQYNGGFGTFDMKTYDVRTVETVLAHMAPEGYKISYRYYIGDYLFIVFFGLLQCMISRIVYHSLISRTQVAYSIFTLSIAIPILRGIADIIENTMLVYTLMRYPVINKAMIEIATIATQIKLGCIKIWGLLIIAGLVMRMIVKYKGIMYKKE